MQHKAGLLAKPAYESYVTGVQFYMSNPGMRIAWQLSSGHFGGEFRSFVDSILRDTATMCAPDAYVEWKRLVQSTPSVPAAQDLMTTPKA